MFTPFAALLFEVSDSSFSCLTITFSATPSPDISINPQVKSAIRSSWHNVKPALARVKSAIAQGWCKQPTGLFVQALKDGVSGDGEAVIVAKVYPRPTLEQLNQLGEMGELVYTKLDKPGYPLVVAVNTGAGVLLWWMVLGLELP